MTLKEQITKEVQELPLEASPSQRDINKYYLGIDNLINITDEFAIGFAEWANENYFSLNTYKKTVTLKELLEIYKKEKGL